MFEVLPPPTAAKVCCQPCRIPEGRPCPTSLLRLGSLRSGWRWWWGIRRRSGGQTTLLMLRLCTRCPWYTSWVTNGSTAVSLPSHCRPSSVLRCTTHRGGFICGGVRSNSPSCRLPWQLHRLLVGCGQTCRAWLLDRHWHSLGQSA